MLGWLVPLVCTFTVLVSATVLVGWAMASERLTRVVFLPGAGVMMPITAVSLLTTGCALWLLRSKPGKRLARGVGLALALLVVGLGGLVLLEYGMQRSFGIDQLLFASTVDGLAPRLPGRPSPLTAMSLMMLGFALLLLHVRTRSGWHPARPLALFVALIATQALIGYAYLEEAPLTAFIGLRAFGRYTPMALHSALLFLLLSVGILSVHPRHGLMGVLLRNDAGGLMARRLLPAVIVLPLLVWGLHLLIEELGYRGGPFGNSVFALVTVLAFVLLLARNANALSRLDARQREVAQSLRISEARLAGIVNNAADAIIAIDEQRDITLFNTGAERIFGYAAGEVLGKPMDLLLNGPLELPSPAALGTVRSDDERWRLSGRRKNGEVFPAEATLADVRVDDVAFRAVILRDMSARVRAEEARRNREALFRTAFDHAPIGMSLVGLDGHFLNVNEALGQMLGYSREEMCAVTFQDLTHPEDLEGDLFQVRRLLEGERGMYQLEKRYRHKLGHSVFVLLTASLVRDSRGEPLHFISQVQDISERKRQERDQHLLAEAGPRLASSLDLGTTVTTVSRLLVPTLADFCIVTMIDERGKVQHRECLASTQEKTQLMEELFGAYPQAHLRRGHALTEVFMSGQSLLLEDVPESLLESTAEDARHLDLLRRLAPSSIIVVPLSARGHTVGVVALGTSESGRSYGPRDLTLCEELARRAALALDNARLHARSEEATHLRDEVLRIVAHDLRAPLNVISLSAGTMMKRSPSERAADSRPLNSIQKAVTRATALIEDLLDVARMQGGGLTVDRRPESTVALLTEALELHRALAEAQSIQLQLDVSPDTPDLFVDRDRVLQLFSNLIGNALKFTPMGGSIILRASPWGEMVRCSVSDTGSGILPEDQHHLFEPFWQARSRAKEGAGLGLTIVKGITEAHGGRVWVDSQPGLGTTFYCSLPAAHSADSSLTWHV
ncbi:PAS domain S-box protein [Myxococcus sp. K38C18041901]|uniref:sensor histidine kinase n=1 Tax=Myxococcus guangdongensis TaxID=2906760 RepID=UPI0020A711A6|nr:PAS domain S-box protein [Myxococcus guangdongensis]MCP3062548.1 PAS domain S-box protein [Myxococcus guangdongensis]